VSPFYRFDHFSREKALIHGVSKKDLTEPYAFSLAMHTGEDPDRIRANRKRIEQALSLDGQAVFVVANQTHSDRIAVVESNGMAGWESTEDAVEDCDALVTDRRGVILTILTADCVPILLYDPVRNVVGAVHAGWRGTESKIVAKTVGLMKQRFGCEPADLLAGIAPAIGSCCYEVGEDVASHFEGYPDALRKQGEKYHLDLPQINRLQLLESGVWGSRIEMSGICTACHVDEFFSYRKEEGCSGRFMSMIGMKEGVVSS
jgi:YfiH family protein